MHIQKAAAKTDTASARAVFAMCANFLLLWVFFRSGAVHGVPFRALGFIFSEGGRQWRGGMALLLVKHVVAVSATSS